ncbi:hypothetical protein QNM18_10745 [Pseudoalteromonas sp. P94(2023)]|uniref:EF-hand domain-containing protein n=2 Tax=Pseudoalteromonas obscura TaxID=3048491 RepID=A0ABT7EKI1_9GAMM|nr:hypothetical protein [Pseudoalteromonas sp. P94(2023)]
MWSSFISVGLDMSVFNCTGSMMILVILCLTPILLYWLNASVLKRKYRPVWLSAIATFVCYASLLINVSYVDHHLEKELKAFDLNNDGFFSETERTPEQQKAMQRVVSDTGRNFAPITGAWFSLGYFLILWSVTLICSWIKRQYVRQVHRT